MVTVAGFFFVFFLFFFWRLVLYGCGVVGVLSVPVCEVTCFQSVVDWSSAGRSSRILDWIPELSIFMLFAFSLSSLSSQDHRIPR